MIDGFQRKTIKCTINQKQFAILIDGRYLVSVFYEPRKSFCLLIAARFRTPYYTHKQTVGVRLTAL